MRIIDNQGYKVAQMTYGPQVRILAIRSQIRAVETERIIPALRVEDLLSERRNLWGMVDMA